MSDPKIVPHLFFDKEARDAAAFYADIFPHSRVTHTRTLHNTPGGDVEVVAFEVAGQPFVAISAGPLFKPTPAISFILNFDPSRDAEARERLDHAWRRLAEGGTVLMPLDKYPFAERYGWVQDKYGISWQLILSDAAGEERPVVVPALLFAGAVAGRAEEAMRFYMGIFEGTKEGQIVRYPPGMAPEKEGSVMFADFTLEGQWFAAMDSAQPHAFAFNEAISLLVRCDTQAEIDRLWSKLSAVPEAERCGWLKDKFGVSWQIAPRRMDEMMRDGTDEQVASVTQAFLAMKKFDLAALERAYAEDA